MIRLAIVISVLGFGYWWGDWYGMSLLGAGLALLGVVMPPKAPETPVEAPQTWEWEKVDRAKRGSDADPTRPDEHPLLLTNTVRRRR